MRWDERLPHDVTSRVPPAALVSYARGTGWVPHPRSRRTEVAVFRRPEPEPGTLIIPVDATLPDYPFAVAEAVRNLAQLEQRPARDILELLLFPPADVLRLGEAGPDADAGHVALDRAVELLAGARKLLLAAARAELGSAADAEAFVGRCRVGQTARGSFVLTVACPLDLPDPPAEGLPEPLGRRVARRAMEALAAAAADRSVPADFADAVGALRPADDRAELTVSVEWCRAVPVAGAEGPVALRRPSADAASAGRPVPAAHPARLPDIMSSTADEGRR